jgi:hypothetical protein
MTSRHTGSCLCGKIRYAITGQFDRFYLCHCSYCRKDTGSAHAANLFSKTARLTWLSGEDSITTYSLPGTRHARSFCAICGSALPLVGSGGVVVPAGSLDTEIAQIPDGNIYTGSRASWDHDLGSAPHHESFPT